MRKPELNVADQRVYDLHHQGFPISRIAKMTGRTEREALTVITGCWYEDKLAAKSAKQSRRS